MKKAHVLIILFVFLTGVESLSGQEKAIHYGGIAMDTDKQIRLERALLTVEYIQITPEETDTLTLTVGPTQSIFWDPGFKTALNDWKKTNASVLKKGYKLKFGVKEKDVLRAETDAVCLGRMNQGNPVQLYKNRSDSSATAYLSYDLASEGRKYLKTMVDIGNLWSWELGTETDTILNYVCCSARSGSYIAWFALSVPVNEGPGLFCGLPGLILRVEKDNEGVVYEALSLQTETNAFIAQDDSLFDKVSCEHFRDAVHRAMNTSLGTWMGEQTIYWTHDTKQ